ncbi:MAG TPA: PfaD family polyunsaturated fatty acid/polyketide biosynthesis protein [Myxococcota bacterium]|nr:PfaD family polyunsaturated fatty acid/polyketide biosynthesis protein [Myxococcota bacterium]
MAAIEQVREPVHVVREGPRGRVGLAIGGSVAADPRPDDLPLLGSLPALYPEWLGDRSFCEVHGLRFPYIAGAMANGIATAEMVVAMARAGMIGFFGAAGLSPERVEANVARIREALPGGEPFGCNLIHSPAEPATEAGGADLYLRHGVTRVSASAYMALSAPIVRYAFAGVREEGGRIVRKNFVFAKISRPEVARRFMSPPPGELLDALVRQGKLTADEARLARRLPVAEDVTVEADSGGHTDNQPLPALFPVIHQLRDELTREFSFERPIRVGAAGGLGTPQAVAAAFGMGAAYVLTGSVNQACVESGLSDEGRRLLAVAGLADVIMAPAADMFELGVKVQVLKRGTMFGPRALKLYELYTAYPSLDALPDPVRKNLEERILGRPIAEIWEETRAFWSRRNPAELARAEADPKHRMALVFRWYLGLSSRWAIAGEGGRKMDYQIWCGPAMGSFNAWTAGTFLEAPEQRTVVQVALNLLEGAAVVTRAQQLRSYGAPVPACAFHFTPRPLGVA